MQEKNNTQFFNIPKAKKENNPHYFLCEELLVPRANCSDGMRLNMFSNHLLQMVHLKNPETPKVFTNFENQFGEHSVAHKEAKEDFVVIDRIEKNQYNYVLIIQYLHSKVYDVIEMHNCKNISESYGYKLQNCIPDVVEGEIVNEGTPIYKTPDYTDEGVYAYGVNLKSVYGLWYGLSYEDGIVISKSAAEKLKSFKVEKTEISINTNDILLNLYGDENIYKSFPKVGDKIENKILVASRRVDYGKAVYELSDKRMRIIDPISDDITYTEGGEVVDIDFFCNMDLRALKKRDNSFSELVDMLEDQQRYYRELAEALEKIIPRRPLTEEESLLEEKGYHVLVSPIPQNENPNKYTDNLGYLWKVSHEYIDEEIKWREDGKSFENVKITFTILKEDPLSEGCKITGRYGNKGIVSSIIDDDKMPITEDGKRAEVLLNALGVMNRLNISQIQEQYINFMSDHLIDWMKENRELTDREEKFFKYMKIISKEQAEFLELKYLTMTRSEKEEFFEEILQDGIYIHQFPFFGNPGMEQFKQLFIEMPELCTEYKFVGIEKPLVMGDLYFIRLKHQSGNKSSVRSTSLTNVRNLPAKNTLKKDAKSIVSSTPIRLGEMETEALFCAKRPDLVEKLFKYYSTSDEEREVIIDELLTNSDPFNLELPHPTTKSINRQVLDKYLALLDLEIEDTLDNE